MLRIRLLILLSACCVVSSGAWADILGYVDCSSHPEETPVFSKPRQSGPVAVIPCGERFTVLLKGFIFSRVETKDGKIGYVLTNVIGLVPDGDAPSLSGNPQVATSSTTPAPADPPRPAVANAAAVAPAPAQPGPLPVTTSPAANTSNAPANPTSVDPSGAAPSRTRNSQVDAVSTTPTPVDASRPAVVSTAVTAPDPEQPGPLSVIPPPAANTSNAPANPTSVDPSGAAPSRTRDSQVDTVSVTPTPVDASRPAVVSAAVTAPDPAQPGPLSLAPPPAANTSNAPAPAPEPTPAHTEASQPQPEAARPEPRPVRAASVQSSWERPLPSARPTSRLELYSGYSYVPNNLNGVMGSFGYNLKPWLQIAGDSSYNIVTTSGVRNVLYANHYGGRFYYRHRGWGFTPFVEGLVGGSRLDTSGGGVKTSTNCLSYKAGGGIDIRVSRHWEIRAVNVDYYHSAFGTNAAQNNNYWASAGVVLRLFGSAGE
ncbi:MAG TPA: hypothetical protein VK829_17575 [Terriglobales bacterium]|jgi:hypothetical protein|nr:hypothetical protein [Terriglobales bacterium]